MIEQLSGQIEMVCDDCGAAYPMTHEAEDRDVLLADAKASGWRAYKKDGARKAHVAAQPPRKTLRNQEWRHSCPACVRAFAANTRRLL
ncbi:unnamed protein product [Laminaria digitata]